MDTKNFTGVLRNKNFTQLWTSQILSVFCANMLNFALSYKIFTVTDRSFGVSMLYLAYYLPVYVIGLFSGVIIDHFSRRKLLVIANVFQAVCVLLYLFIGESIILIYPIVFLYSFMDQFYLPSEAAYLPELVEKEKLPAANTFFNFAQFGGLFFGFVLGGPIMKLFGVNSPYYIASVFLWIAAISTYLLPKDNPPKPTNLLRENFTKRAKENIFENIAFITRRPKIYMSMFINLAFLMFNAVLAVTLPALGKELFNVDLLDLSWMLIFPLAVGAGVGALFVDRGVQNGGKQRLITIGGFISSIVLVFLYVTGQIANLVPFVSQNLPIFIISLSGILGYAISLIIIPTQVTLQEETPNELRGRVYGSQKLLQGIFLVFPSVFAATFADLLGVGNLFLGIGVAVFIGALVSIKYKKK